MIDRDKVRANLTEWLENPSWAEYYGGAPSERCREFIALEFYYSEYEEEEASEAMDGIEDEMDAEELRYLFARAGTIPGKGSWPGRLRKGNKNGLLTGEQARKN